MSRMITNKIFTAAQQYGVRSDRSFKTYPHDNMSHEPTVIENYFRLVRTKGLHTCLYYHNRTFLDPSDTYEPVIWGLEITNIMNTLLRFHAETRRTN